MNGTRRYAPTVYPRVCGGSISAVQCAAVARGLSPRVRGIRRIRSSSSSMMRSIPACAGDPQRRVSSNRNLRVYPRVCGGSARRPARPRSQAGLSPRVRGIRAEIDENLLPLRSIPACAGDPLLRHYAPLISAVYPRVCGGSSSPSLAGASSGGLSPRVRGILADIVEDLRGRGSIPACAGDPERPVCGGGAATVYPRVCGGSPSPSQALARASGLSPRVRGIPRRPLSATPKPRSIPACAGDPPRPRRRIAKRRVYPRVCGGSHAAHYRQRQSRGLSPRVRGIHVNAASLFSPMGSIPACAGDPWSLRGRRLMSGVYPRVCGGSLR